MRCGVSVVRAAAAYLGQLVDRLRRAPRYRVRYKARLLFDASPINTESGGSFAQRPPALEANTYDISSTGLALIVPTMYVGGHYFTVENRRLRVVLELPAGPIEMSTVPVRFEPFSRNETGTDYLIGLHILEVSDEGRFHLTEYMNTLRQGQRVRPGYLRCRAEGLKSSH